jgi:hypothetical protein
MNQSTLDFSGQAEGHRLANIAADHAGDDWKQSAFDAFCSYARQHESFTVEEVRNASKVPQPPTNKAWGAIAIRARDAGIVVAAGLVKVARGRMVATLWRAV